MKKLILTAAVSAIVGGFIGVAATPNETPDACVLAFMKAEQMLESPMGAKSVAPVYMNLRDTCLTGE